VLWIAAAVSLFPSLKWRWVPAGVGAAGLVIAAFIASEGVGIWSAKPFLNEPEFIPSTEKVGWYDVSITLGNRTPMGKSFWLGATSNSRPNPAVFALEHKIGGDSWENAGAPAQVKYRQTPRSKEVTQQAFSLLEMEAGSSVTFSFRLQPGTYRARLAPGLRWNCADVENIHTVGP
jgi:hypothetical protein